MTTGPGTSGRDGGLNLQTTIARLLPTPWASDGEKGGPNQRGSSGDPMLPSVIAKLLPTPTVTNQSGNKTNGRSELLLAGIIEQVIANGGIDWGDKEPAIRRWEAIWGPHPFPGALGPKMGVKPSPEFVEWMMGLEPGHVSSADFLTINDKLRLLGNGVVPPQAEAAIRRILSELDGNEEVMTQDTSSFFTTHQTRDVPRDQYGRYKLPGPDGPETSWTRATTFAATLAEQYGLRIWKERQVVWGLSRRPDLITMASTIVGPEDKKVLGEIVTEAHIAAGTDAKANRGTAIHLACAAAEAGAFERVPEELRPHVAGYFKAMRDGGLEILPEYVERTGIVKQYGVAGTLDNLVRCPDGKVRVADKKTGRMDYSDTEFAVQMALYAHFDALFNYDTNAYEPMPEVATDYAILAHIDPETGHTELLRINIEWGWVWARTCAEVRDIRDTKHVITPYVRPEGSMAIAAVNKLEASGWRSPEFGRSVTATPDGSGQAAPTYVPLAETVNVPGPAQVEVNGADISTAVASGSASPTPQSVVFAPGTPGLGTVPGGYVDTTSSVPPEIQAFWSDDLHDEDGDGEQTVNGVPLEQYGAASRQWGCFTGQPCEFTGTEGLHSDGTVCLYGNARPGPIPPMPSQSESAAAPAEGDAELAASDAAEHIATQGVDPYELVAAIDGLKGGKAAVQNVARRLMAKLGIKEGDPGSIKLNQYKIKVARACVDLAHKHGVSIPGAKDDQPDFGVPSGPAPTGDAPTSSAGAPAPKKAQGDAGAAEVPSAQAPDPAREEKLRTAVRSIMACGSIEQLQKVHTHYSGTSLGWTDEMQTAARTRALELEQSGDESPLTPLEMIQGATSRETLSKAWEKATQGGTDMAGWTEDLNAAALAKQTELSGGGA